MRKVVAIVSLIFFSFQEKPLEGTVTGVQDGDTLEVTIGGKVVVVRLQGVDCPEDGQAFSAKAKQYTMAYTMGKKVTVQKVTIDKYGRMIALVFLEDGKSFNEELVRVGYAWHFKLYSNDEKLAQLEKEAQKKRLGLWVEDSPVAPWDYKAKQQANH